MSALEHHQLVYETIITQGSCASEMEELYAAVIDFVPENYLELEGKKQILMGAMYALNVEIEVMLSVSTQLIMEEKALLRPGSARVH